MRTAELFFVYGAIGVACAVALLAVARGRILDAALLVPFWPLYGPFLVLGATSRAPGAVAELATLLPGEDAVAQLEQRVALAQGKVEQIDRLLLRDDFSIAEVEARHRALEARGDTRAAASARARLENIRRLVRLRDRFLRELVEVDELLAQLRVQAEVVRLSGAMDDGTRDLVNEIVARVEGLDAILEDPVAPNE